MLYSVAENLVAIAAVTDFEEVLENIFEMFVIAASVFIGFCPMFENFVDKRRTVVLAFTLLATFAVESKMVSFV